MVSAAVGIADGSWELTVFVTDVDVEKTLRVKGDLHVGGLMLRLVEGLGTLKRFFCIPFEKR